MNKKCNFGVSFNVDETIAFGKKLAKYVEAGDIYKLEGDLGAGKTTFIKGVLEAMGYSGIVNSPTYTLINEYMIEPKVIHIDCYREDNLDRWHMLGINEYFDNKSIVFIEWPEILEPILPLNNLYKISIESLSENKREIRLA